MTWKLGFYYGFKRFFLCCPLQFFSLKIHSATKLLIIQPSLLFVLQLTILSLKSILLRRLGSMFCWWKFYTSYHHCQCRGGKMSRTYLLRMSWVKTCIRVFLFLLLFSYGWSINRLKFFSLLFDSCSWIYRGKINLCK